MEASIIFHFAGRGDRTQRLALIDFAQLLDPRWRAPHDEAEDTTATSASFLNQFAHSAYNFMQGGELCILVHLCGLAHSFWCSGMAGAFGATIVYPIDLGKLRTRWAGSQ